MIECGEFIQLRTLSYEVALDARQWIAHYDSLLELNEWIILNPVSWTVIEPMNGPQPIEEIGERLSGVHDFSLKGFHVKEAMEDLDNPSLFMGSFDDGYFFFDTYDLAITQDKIIELIGEGSYIWSIHWHAGAVRRKFRYLVDGHMQMNTADVLQDDGVGGEYPLFNIIDDIRSAWRVAPGRYKDSTMLALISMSSGAVLTDSWLESIQDAFITENLH